MSSTGRARAAYVLAASPRTGSSWLCGLLSSTGYAGYPVEYARDVDERVWRGSYGFTSHATYFWSLPALSSTPNGVFGLKLLWPQMVCLTADIRRYTSTRASTMDETVSDWMDRPAYFWLRRRDRVRQAVSFAHALETDCWASPQRGNGKTPAYERESVERALALVTAEDDSWAEFFRTASVDVREIWYEDLAGDPGGVLGMIAESLGLGKPTQWRSPMQPQRSADKDAWVRRFRESGG